MFITAHWSMFITANLKSLSDHFNISAWSSICWLPFFVLFEILVFWHDERIFFLFFLFFGEIWTSFVLCDVRTFLNLLLSLASTDTAQQEKEEVLPYSCQGREEVWVPQQSPLIPKRALLINAGQGWELQLPNRPSLICPQMERARTALLLSQMSSTDTGGVWPLYHWVMM